MNRSVTVVLLFVVAGCATSSHVSGSSDTSGIRVSTAPSSAFSPSASVTSPSPALPAAKPPHFSSPEAAMRYLATAWNDRDAVALRHVTDPSARYQLDAMHSEAVNLKLSRCTRQPAGDYQCTFSHDFPSGYQRPMAEKHGEAVFLVGPALTPGWYMTVYQHCG